MNILVAVPRFVQTIGESYAFPLGIGYISSALKEAGHTVHCLNLNHEPGEPAELIRRAVETHDPDVFGTGTITPYFRAARDILSAARRAKPGIVNVVGGGLFSSAPDTMTATLDIDYGVAGEGERTIVELMDTIQAGRDPATVSGLHFRGRGGEWQAAAPREAIQDLDTVPWPDYEALGIQTWMATAMDTRLRAEPADTPPRAVRPVTMLSSRACPFQCSFCFHPLGRTFRERGLDDVFAELDFLVRTYQPNYLALADELFSLRRERVLEFCERIRPYGIEWTTSLHVSIADRALLTAMRKAGCDYIGYGLESADNSVLAGMGKHITQADIGRALKATREERIEIQGNFIFSDASETVETANNTLHWWAEHHDYQMFLIPVQVYPGTPLYAKALAKGRIPDAVAHIDHPVVNATDMDDRTYLRLYQRIRLFRETILVPAPVESFDADPDGGDGPAMFRIVWSCPRCGARNRNRRVYDTGDSFQSFRLACHACRSRFDVPNLARRPWIHDEAEALYGDAARLRQTGRITEAVEGFRRVIGVPVADATPDRPAAFIRAAFDIGSVFLDAVDQGRADLASNAEFWLAKALMLSAFDPNCHVAYARAVLAEGCDGAARLHLRQAARLMEWRHAGSDPAADSLRRMADAIPAGDPIPRYIV